MGSCVSKKAARAGAVDKVVATQLPPEKEVALPPPVVVVEEEEVKEVLPESAVSRPRLPEPEKEVVKRSLQEPKEDEEEEEASESASVASAAAEKAKAKANAGREQEREQEVDGMEKGRERRRRTPEQRKPKEAGNGRARSPSPASARRRQCAGGENPAPPRPRREQPAVVYGIGCRSGRFSPSAARKAAESAVRRTHSAREADMMLPHSSRAPASKRSLNAAINGNGNANGGGGAVRREAGERSGRRPDSPTSKRFTPASPTANGSIQRQATLGGGGGGATRKAAKECSTLEQYKPQCGGGRTQFDDPDEPALEGGDEHMQAAEGALGQNPAVAMECFIFL